MVYNKNVTVVNGYKISQEQYDFANQNFTIGQEILTEEALIVGPIAEPKCPICMGCGVAVNALKKCYDCGWPICNFDCDKLEHHKSYECNIFRKCSNMSFQRLSPSRGVFHQYDCILPLRMLMLSEKSPEVWKSVQMLKSCEDIRRDTTVWQKEKTYVVKYIRQKCKLKKFDEELIHKVCGILDSNCFLTNTKNNLRCMYKTANYISHSCIPNTTYVVSPRHNFRLFIRAAVDIAKGDRLFRSKVKTILPTLLRRQELVHTSCLSCECRRCSDPTELNTNFSSLRCNKCKIGYLITQDPLDFEADWKCSNCSSLKKYAQLKKVYNDAEKELNEVENMNDIDESIKLCEKLLQKYESMFHYNHAFIVFLKYNSLMGFNERTFHISDLETINRKIIRLYEIFNVFNILAPGYTVLRGTTLNWLYKAYVAKAKWYDTNISNKCELYVENMTKALRFLEMTEKIMIIGEPFMRRM